MKLGKIMTSVKRHPLNSEVTAGRFNQPTLAAYGASDANLDSLTSHRCLVMADGEMYPILSSACIESPI